MDQIAAALTSALSSFVLAAVLVLTTPQHGRYSMGLPGAIQKFHSHPTPRIGGICIYLALILAYVVVASREAAHLLLTVLVAGAPALLMGLLEDFTGRITVLARLAATFASGTLACWIGGTALTHLAVPGFDRLLEIPPLSVLFTAFALAGVANAINMVDGFHGLASGTTVIALTALATIASQVGDIPLVVAALLVAATVAGFWLVNFPWGKLFLGDGGAYFAGFALAWMAVLLPTRNPSVSPWASLLVCGYPVIEVLYSVARRWHSRQPAGRADRAHLHSLVASRVVQPHLRGLDPTLQNSAVSVLMWICAAIPAFLGVTFYRHTPSLVLSAAGCVLLYHLLYRQVARS